MSGYKRVSFYELCRLCASNNQKDKTHIFQEEGRKIQLQSKIKTCLSLSVYENDFLPKVVCSKCLQSLETCYIFQQECVGSETMLSTYFRNFRWTEDFKKSGKVYIKDTKTLNQPEEKQLQQAQQQSYAEPQQQEQKQSIPVEAIPYFTLQLPTIVTNPSVINKSPPKPENLETKLQNFVTKSKPEVLSNVVVNSNGEVLNISQLYEFDNTINQQQQQQQQQQIKSSSKKVTKRKDVNIDDSVIKIDLTEETYEKQVKGETVQKYNYNIVKPVEKPQQINTVILNQDVNFQPYSTTTSLYTQPQPNLNVVSNPNGLNVVQESSTVNLNALNQMSDMNQNNYRNYSAQKPAPDNNPTDEKTHQCDICKKSFKRREHLYQHVKLHTGFRPYKCDNCNKAFGRKEHLLRHMTLHSGQKNYKCVVCDKSFSRRDNLLKHKKTHDKQSNFTCEICQKQFVMKHYYIAHKITHGEKFQVASWDLIKT
ncbi:zinc finger protein 184 [Aethina tumida]|uniref:zinc finger protein 184 n=1 Tax=Aethina tumida TaxID=116153 RepID=UPI00096AF5E8|nr:zinc finger protein 184 [Aethina tumida]